MPRLRGGRETRHPFIIPFAHDQFGSLRIIKDEETGEPWFVAKDVAEALGYVWKGIATIKHVPKEWGGVYSVQTPSGEQEVLCLSEQGLYFFLGRSDKPKAIPYQMWLAGDVVPSIREHGGYLTPSKVEEALLNPDTLIQLAMNLKEERTKRLEAEAIP